MIEDSKQFDELRQDLDEELLSIRNDLRGNSGKDGADAKVNEEKIIVKTALAVLKRIKQPENGKDGKDAKPIDENKVIVKAVSEVLKRIPTPKDGEHGKDGKNAPPVDEDKLIKTVLSKIPEPTKIDTKELEQKILSKVPKVDLSPIKDKLDLVTEKTFKRVKQVEEATKDINKRLSFQSANQNTSYGGEGDTVVAGTNITITTDGNGSKVINASVPSGLKLKTNGTPNGSQTLLNLVAGSNITLTDGGTGNVTIASTGGGGTPGGSNTQFQYNNSGAFGGTAGLTITPNGLGVSINDNFNLVGGVITDNSFNGANNYNPTGLATASVLRIQSNGLKTLTGLAGGVDGRIMVITNPFVGVTSVLQITNQDSNSSAANRFLLYGDSVTLGVGTLTLIAGASAVFRYDGTLSRWVCIANGAQPQWGQIVGTLSDQNELQSALNTLTAGVANSWHIGGNILSGGENLGSTGNTDWNAIVNNTSVMNFSSSGITSHQPFTIATGDLAVTSRLGGGISGFDNTTGKLISNYSTDGLIPFQDISSGVGQVSDFIYLKATGSLGVNNANPFAAGDFTGKQFTLPDVTAATLVFDFTGSGYSAAGIGSTWSYQAYTYKLNAAGTAFSVNPFYYTATEGFDPSSLGAVQDEAGGTYTANGSSYNYSVYAIYNGKWNAAPATVTFTDNNDGNPYQVDLSWTAPAVAPDSYVVVNTTTNTAITGVMTTSTIDPGTWGAFGGVGGGITFNLDSTITVPTGIIDGYRLLAFFPGSINSTKHLDSTVNGIIDDNSSWVVGTTVTPNTWYTPPIRGIVNGVTTFISDDSGRTGIDQPTPTALLHIGASTGAAGYGPFKIDAGTLVSTPEAGLEEFDGVNYYLTI